MIQIGDNVKFYGKYGDHNTALIMIVKEWTQSEFDISFIFNEDHIPQELLQRLNYVHESMIFLPILATDRAKLAEHMK